MGTVCAVLLVLGAINGKCRLVSREEQSVGILESSVLTSLLRKGQCI